MEHPRFDRTAFDIRERPLEADIAQARAGTSRHPWARPLLRPAYSRARHLWQSRHTRPRPVVRRYRVPQLPNRQRERSFAEGAELRPSVEMAQRNATAPTSQTDTAARGAARPAPATRRRRGA